MAQAGKSYICLPQLEVGAVKVQPGCSGRLQLHISMDRRFNNLLLTRHALVCLLYGHCFPTGLHGYLQENVSLFSIQLPQLLRRRLDSLEKGMVHRQEAMLMTLSRCAVDGRRLFT